MKKFFRKKVILVLALLIFIFFTAFKYFKGKSFFDTIIEYSNDIYSQNSNVLDANLSNYENRKIEYIPLDFTDYGEFSESNHIVKSNEDGNLYIYNDENGEKNLFEEINENSKIQNLVLNKKYVAWIETSDREEKDKKIYTWTIFIKDINTGKKESIDNQIYILDSKDSKKSKFSFPEDLDIEENDLIYKRYIEKNEKKYNIISSRVITEIINYNFNNKKGDVIAHSDDINKEIIFRPRMDLDNIIWEKIIINEESGEVDRTELYLYNKSKANKEKIYESNKINYIDIKENKIAIVIANPDENIIIYDIKKKNKTNILYKGSKAEKYSREETEVLDITNIEFIDYNNILVNLSTRKDGVSALVYNISNDLFYNFNKDLYNLDDEQINQGIIYSAYKGKLKANVGRVLEEKSEDALLEESKNNENGEENKEIYDYDGNIDVNYEGNIYYKYYNYTLK